MSTMTDQPGEHHNQEQVQAALAYVDHTTTDEQIVIIEKAAEYDHEQAIWEVEHQTALRILAAHCRRLEQRVAYCEPLIPVLEGREAKLAKQLLFTQGKRESAEAALAAAQAERDRYLGCVEALEKLLKKQENETPFDAARRLVSELAAAQERIGELEACDVYEKGSMARMIAHYEESQQQLAAARRQLEEMGAKLEKRIEDYLNERACCDGHECGCMGVSRLEQFVWEYTRTKLTDAQSETLRLGDGLVRAAMAVTPLLARLRNGWAEQDDAHSKSKALMEAVCEWNIMAHAAALAPVVERQANTYVRGAEQIDKLILDWLDEGNQVDPEWSNNWHTFRAAVLDAMRQASPVLEPAAQPEQKEGG